jgi:hemerythrin-like metal-binding protein
MTIYAPVEWNDSLQTGVADIDRQHRILVNTLNDLAAKLSDRPKRQRIEQVTRDLLAYAIYHFETEEELIKRYGYDTAEPEDAHIHVQQHRSFSERVVALRADAHDGKSQSQVALLSFLKDWLMNHICTTDQRLGKFISAKSAQTKLE